MKKIIFLFFLPLWGLGGSAFASVTVTPLSVNYNARTVTFRVEYAGAANNRAWVWIDLCPVPDVTPSAFQRAVISEVSVAGGSWDNTSLNGRGFYVTANGSTVTATLDNAAGKFNWCAYGSDFPPNAVENGSSYTLKGSPPFILTTSSGTVEVNARTYSGSTITALTDATGCPGVLCSKNGETEGLLGCCGGTTECNGTCKTTGTCVGTCASCLAISDPSWPYATVTTTVCYRTQIRITPYVTMSERLYRWIDGAWKYYSTNTNVVWNSTSNLTFCN
jgi:hypothetical protein